MDFSIVLASRERVSLLDALLKSIRDTTADSDSVEVFIGIDTDDHATLKYAATEKVFKNTKFLPRQRDRFLNEHYLNWAWRNNASGKYIIACNDDSRFVTPNWDQIAREKLNDYLKDKPDGILYGWISDCLLERAYGMKYCCFPLVSAVGARVLDWVMPPEYPGWGADIVLYRVYEKLGRICDLSDVTIDHISYHSGKRERDDISRYVQLISRKAPDPATYNIIPAVDKLKQRISENPLFL